MPPRYECPTSSVFAGMFIAILEGELGDSRFIELAQAFGNHPVVLFLRCVRQRQIETEAAREVERNSAVFGCVRRGEKAGVLAILHIFAIGFKDARGRAPLRKNFS